MRAIWAVISASSSASDSVPRTARRNNARLPWKLPRSSTKDAPRVTQLKEQLEQARTARQTAQGLYVAFGFAQVGRRPRYYGGVTDALVMSKNLL